MQVKGMKYKIILKMKNALEYSLRKALNADFPINHKKNWLLCRMSDFNYKMLDEYGEEYVEEGLQELCENMTQEAINERFKKDENQEKEVKEQSAEIFRDYVEDTTKHEEL